MNYTYNSHPKYSYDGLIIHGGHVGLDWCLSNLLIDGGSSICSSQLFLQYSNCLTNSWNIYSVSIGLSTCHQLPFQSIKKKNLPHKLVKFNVNTWMNDTRRINDLHNTLPNENQPNKLGKLNVHTWIMNISNDQSRNCYLQSRRLEKEPPLTAMFSSVPMEKEHWRAKTNIPAFLFLKKIRASTLFVCQCVSVCTRSLLSHRSPPVSSYTDHLQYISTLNIYRKFISGSPMVSAAIYDAWGPALDAYQSQIVYRRNLIIWTITLKLFWNRF